MKKSKIMLVIFTLLIFSGYRVYAKDNIAEDLDKKWYCNIVKGNAVTNYFNLPSVQKGLKIKRDDYETSADYDDAIDYYNLENYRITLDFKSKNKVAIGWTGLLYNDNYEDSQYVSKNYTYQVSNNQGNFVLESENYPFTLNNQVLAIPSQNIVCYADLIEAQKQYELYKLNEKFDKSVADDNGFVIQNGILTKYIGTKKRLILPATVSEISDFDSDNVYYFGSLVIPGNVKMINDSAFKYLNTDDLVIAEGVQEIGNEAFYDADFVDIYLPSSVVKIGTQAFRNKTSEKPTFHVVRGSYADNYLKSNYAEGSINIKYDYENNSSIVKKCQDYINYTYDEIKSFIDSDGFGIKNNILYACNKKATEITIPANVVTIASEAFSDYYNSKVKTIIVPANVKTIENGSFSYTSAKTIIVAEGLEKLESQAFSDVYAKDIYLPATIKEIGRSIFDTEDGLKGTVFHVEKDSEIAKYLEKNPPQGKFEIVYDYKNVEKDIVELKSFKKVVSISVIAIIITICAIILLISNYKNAKKEEKVELLKEKKHSRRLKKLANDIITTTELGLDNDLQEEPKILKSIDVKDLENNTLEEDNQNKLNDNESKDKSNNYEEVRNDNIDKNNDTSNSNNNNDDIKVSNENITTDTNELKQDLVKDEEKESSKELSHENEIAVDKKKNESYDVDLTNYYNDITSLEESDSNNNNNQLDDDVKQDEEIL